MYLSHSEVGTKLTMPFTSSFGDSFNLFIHFLLLFQLLLLFMRQDFLGLGLLFLFILIGIFLRVTFFVFVVIRFCLLGLALLYFSFLLGLALLFFAIIGSGLFFLKSDSFQTEVAKSF